GPADLSVGSAFRAPEGAAWSTAAPCATVTGCSWRAPPRPIATPAIAAAARAAGTAASATRRQGTYRRRDGSSAAAAISRTRSRSSAGADGFAARRASGDIALHLLFQACERAGEPRRARRLADSEDAGGRPAVEL